MTASMKPSDHLSELSIARNSRDARRHMPAIGPHHGRVLDIGCGAGQTLIASPLRSGALAVGLDLDHDALVLGHQLAPGLPLLRARAETLPFPDASFDLVVCRVALPYMHMGRAVGEMARVLSPDGDLWLLLHPWRMTAREFGGALRRLRLRSALHRAYVTANSLLFHLTGTEVPWPPTGSFESFQTERGVRRALALAGFRDIGFDRTRAFVATARRSDPGSHEGEAVTNR